MKWFTDCRCCNYYGDDCAGEDECLIYKYIYEAFTSKRDSNIRERYFRNLGKNDMFNNNEIVARITIDADNRVKIENIWED